MFRRPIRRGFAVCRTRTNWRGCLGTLTEARRKGARLPILLKIAPDLDAAALDDIAHVVLESGIEGLDRFQHHDCAAGTGIGAGQGAGRPVGAPLFAPSTEILRQMRRRVGSRIVLVGVGGIASGADAYAKIRAGASLVQLYTALVYEGPGLVTRIKRELANLLARDGFASLGAAVGADVKA